MFSTFALTFANATTDSFNIDVSGLEIKAALESIPTKNVSVELKSGLMALQEKPYRDS